MSAGKSCTHHLFYYALETPLALRISIISLTFCATSASVAVFGSASLANTVATPVRPTPSLPASPLGPVAPSLPAGPWIPWIPCSP